MRKTLLWWATVLGLLAALGLAPAQAIADGPSGSTECAMADDDCDGAVDEDTSADLIDQDGDGSDGEDPAGDATDTGENQVACDGGQDVDGMKLYAGAEGAEVCSDGTNANAPQGRVIASTDGYVAADGEASNPAPADGYARLDSGGIRCGDASNQDSTAADQTSNTADDCNAG